MRQRNPLLKSRALSLPLWQKRAIYFSVAGLTLTGVGWLGLHFLSMQAISELPPWRSPMQWLIKLHVAIALLGLVAFGSLISSHISMGWKMNQSRFTGVANLTFWVCLTMTGYLLWYAPEGAMKQSSVWLHWALGVGMPIGLVHHLRRSSKGG
jgi:hypothetical protein